ncbi:hypothetical protein C8Q80DRAFT_1123629 [Daedaleopsis nitida]|nr:hypothetical protein C8Q80DRAFT_1123629 [Daedaleopsis nitida]
MTRYVLVQGENVAATHRNPALLREFALKYSMEQLAVAQLDVTDHQGIKGAFQQAKEIFGLVDVVFNNVVHILVGEAESTADVLARKVFEVNFWGVVHVSLEAVRFFREENARRTSHKADDSSRTTPLGAPSGIRAYGSTARQSTLTGRVGDAAKGLRRIFDLSQLPDLPQRLQLGLDTIQFCRGYIDELRRDLQDYAHWSNVLNK